MGTYKFSTTANKMEITLSGNFDQATVGNFVKQFQTEVGKIQPSSSELIVKVSQMQVQPADMQSTLKGCFELYESVGFKKIVFNVGANAVLAMQARRIAREAGLSNVEII